ncbi:hypothetical protein CEP54_001526 [Fusarium duplospermum]|uniref:Xylanolytic transcriptional activator regulatory domain-containing protein n=1 Tax=Fusarium duplospermum TaxID=1325734 RepID=A0A428R0W4_9HYPO|nr:hypothetical protein CEP54_001526 [Fusarium duplospermum]
MYNTSRSASSIQHHCVWHIPRVFHCFIVEPTPIFYAYGSYRYFCRPLTRPTILSTDHPLPLRAALEVHHFIDPPTASPVFSSFASRADHLLADYCHHCLTILEVATSEPHSLPCPHPKMNSLSFAPQQYTKRVTQDAYVFVKDRTRKRLRAPYLRTKISFRQEEQPAIEDSEKDAGTLLPPMPALDLRIRIPPELMPDDETARRYFDLYFDNVHPYVPVLCRTTLCQQWNTDRESIPPPILETIFAIGGQLAGEPTDNNQRWLALASMHADSSMDAPRLSTLQALLMILKAREAAPACGYYYRSWMTVAQCVQMGKDLGLDEHYRGHRMGLSCACSPAQCQLLTRIWQVVFVCEVMVGAPQGRHDYAIGFDSVDLSPPRLIPNCKDPEYRVSRNFTYFAQVVRIIAIMGKVYQNLRDRKRWGIEPEFRGLGLKIDTWLAALPAELAMPIPQGGSLPCIQSHFIGNMHAHYHLTLILFNRPILSFLNPNVVDGLWKHHMMTCFSSAKTLCMLQEATLESFGLVGLQCMQRGFSFSLYSGLSCIIIYLIAMESPSPDFDTDAREFLTRHMRVLEKVMKAWSIPKLEKQFNALREALSADIQEACNLTSIVEQCNTTFGTPTHSQTNPLNSSTSDATEAPPIVDIHAAQTSPATGAQQFPPPQYSTLPVPNFVTPAMWQESVISVYDEVTKRP